MEMPRQMWRITSRKIKRLTGCFTLQTCCHMVTISKHEIYILCTRPPSAKLLYPKKPNTVTTHLVTFCKCNICICDMQCKISISENMFAKLRNRANTTTLR